MDGPRRRWRRPQSAIRVDVGNTRHVAFVAAPAENDLAAFAAAARAAGGEGNVGCAAVESADVIPPCLCFAYNWPHEQPFHFRISPCRAHASPLARVTVDQATVRILAARTMRGRLLG